MLKLNYILKVQLLLIFLGSMLSSTNLVAQNIYPERRAYLLDSISNNPSGKIYFFDGIEISEIDFYKKAFDGELNGLEGTGFDSKQESIEKFGEYYRHGVLLFGSNGSTDGLKAKHSNMLSNTITSSTAKNHIDEDSYQLKGTIDNKIFEGKPIMLFSLSDNRIFSVDTTLIVNGKFEFVGKEKPNNIGVLSIGNYPDSVVASVVFLDKGNIKADMTNNRIGGTPLNDLYQGYIDTSTNLEYELNNVPMDDDEGSGNDMGLFVRNGSPLHKKMIEIGEYTVGFKKKNIHNIVGQYIFKKEAGRLFAERMAYPPTDTCQDSAFYIIYNEADESLKQKDWVKSHIELLERQAELIENVKLLEGNKFVDFTLTDLSEESRQLSDYIGKSRYTLLDFWASWCGPCISLFPKLKDFYNKYDRDDLEIISISIDVKKDAWMNAVIKQELPWKHLATLSSLLNNDVQEKYAFKGIPHTVLLDDKGNIIATNISITDMSKLIVK